MAEKSEFWAFSEKPALLAELIAGASRLAAAQGGTAAALIVGSQADSERAFSLGAHKVYWLGEKGSHLVDDFVPTLAALAKDKQPAALLVGATKTGKAVAGRLAARLGITTLTDLKGIESAGGTFQVRHMIFGGGAVREEKPKGGLLLATAGLGIFEPLTVEAGKTGEVVKVDFLAPAWQVKVVGAKPKAASTVNLAAAKKVVCAGRGVGKQEDLAMLGELARLLEGEVGCTRPLAEGLDWLPRERYIGVSGAFLKADLYLGIGVSGQVQHTVGVNDCRVIVAINKDEHAPIFEQADYGIAGDLYQVVPALIQALKARK
jgi:electron transfer flavoprotein alpha subunit